MLKRNIRKFQNKKSYQEAIKEIQNLYDKGLTHQQISDRLNWNYLNYQGTTYWTKGKVNVVINKYIFQNL